VPFRIEGHPVKYYKPEKLLAEVQKVTGNKNNTSYERAETFSRVLT